MIPGNDQTESCSNGCCTGYDGFEIGLTSGKGDLQDAIAGASAATTVQDWGLEGFSGSPGSGYGGSSYAADACTWG